MGLTMGNDRSLLLQGLAGGVLAGLGLCWSGPWWMLPALALLWSSARSPWAAALWGASAIAISHCWLLALHPLTWLGVPALLSLPLAMAVWLICALAAAVLTAAWSVVGRCLPSPGTLPHALVLALIWGLTETLLARAPLFWIGVGGSVLPGDPWLAGLSRWVGAGGLASVQLLLGWGLWRLWLLSRTDTGFSWRWSGQAALTLAVVHAFGALALYGGAPGQPLGEAMSLALWQPAIPTREKFSDRRQAELPGRFHAVEARAQRDGAQLLLAPEGTLPLDRRRFDDNALPVISGGFRWVAGQQRSALLRPSGFRSAHRDRQASVGPLGGMVSRMAWTQRTLGCRWAGGGVGFTAVALGRSSCSGGHLLRDQQRHGSGSRSRGRGAVDSGRGQPRSLSTAAAASIPGPGGVAQSGNRPAVGIRGQHRAQQQLSRRKAGSRTPWLRCDLGCFRLRCNPAAVSRCMCAGGRGRSGGRCWLPCWCCLKRVLDQASPQHCLAVVEHRRLTGRD